MALAEKMLASKFNMADGLHPIDHYTYTFLGDGCLMEGISHEVCSFAGTPRVWENLFVFMTKTGISIDGKIENWFTDNTTQRFESYNWQVIEVDGHNVERNFRGYKKCAKGIKQTNFNLL